MVAAGPLLTSPALAPRTAATTAACSGRASDRTAAAIASGGAVGPLWGGCRVIVSVNECTSVSTNSGTPVTRTYDANGNLTGDGMNEYFYDRLNRLVRVVEKAGPTTIGEYAYDAQSRRVRRVAGGQTVLYTYLGGRVVEEFDEGWQSPLLQYVWGGEGLLQIFGGWISLYVHENGYGSAVRTTNDLSGEATSIGAWDHCRDNAYGEATNWGTVAFPVVYQYRGMLRDAETELYLLRGGRTLSARLGAALTRATEIFGNRYSFQPIPAQAERGGRSQGPTLEGPPLGGGPEAPDSEGPEGWGPEASKAPCPVLVYADAWIEDATIGTLRPLWDEFHGEGRAAPELFGSSRAHSAAWLGLTKSGDVLVKKGHGAGDTVGVTYGHKGRFDFAPPRRRTRTKTASTDGMRESASTSGATTTVEVDADVGNPLLLSPAIKYRCRARLTMRPGRPVSHFQHDRSPHGLPIALAVRWGPICALLFGTQGGNNSMNTLQGMHEATFRTIGRNFVPDELARGCRS